MTDSGTVWKRVGLAGCGCLTLLATAAGLLVARHWSSITAGYRQAASAMAELAPVQSALQSHYETPEVAVLWRVHSGASERVLVVRIANPKGLSMQRDGQEKELARQIARLAREKVKDPAAVRTVEVTLMRKAGVGFTVSRSNVFQFTADELSAVPPERDDSPGGNPSW